MPPLMPFAMRKDKYIQGIQKYGGRVVLVGRTCSLTYHHTTSYTIYCENLKIYMGNTEMWWQGGY